jgi:hypothetical protein
VKLEINTVPPVLKETCDYCGRPNESKANRYYCSANCRDNFSYNSKKINFFRQKLHTKKCLICQKNFTTAVETNECCGSNNCRAKFHVKIKFVDASCINCGAIVPLTNYYPRQHVTCGTNCYRQHLDKIIDERVGEQRGILDLQVLMFSTTPEAIKQRVVTLIEQYAASDQYYLKNDKKPARLEAFRRKIFKCSICIHGRESAVSDSGWECSLQQAMYCRPVFEARLFEQKVLKL